MALLWKHPFTAIVAGPSGCGKTSFVIHFIEHASQIIVPSPKRIIWCYGAYQNAFDQLPDDVHLHDGIPNADELQPDSLLILDDLMGQIDNRVNDIFTKFSHHRNVSILFLTQNIFHKQQRTMTLNSHYLVLFKNPRDTSQIGFLARQMFPGKPKYLIDVFKDATSEPYSYLVIDLRADTEDKHRLRSGIFPDENNYVYLPK
jgi:hypothetical protein